MSKRKTLTVAEWVIRGSLEKNQNEFKSIHFDSLKDFHRGQLEGLKLLKYGSSLLREARITIERIIHGGTYFGFKPIVYFPLGYTQNLALPKNLNWEEIGKDEELPSLYLIPKNELFDIVTEEYRAPFELPDEEKSLIALYRCFRDQQTIENDWEFAMGIYLFYKGDF